MDDLGASGDPPRTGALAGEARATAAGVARRWRDVANTLVVDVVALVSLTVIVPITFRGLGPERYGQYTTLYIIFGLIGLWLYAAPSAAVTQLILQGGHSSARMLQLARRQFLMFGIPAVGLAVAIAVLTLGTDLFVPAVLVLVLDLGLTSAGFVNVASVLAVEGIAASSRLRVLQPLARAAGVGVVAIAGTVTLESLLAVNIVASALLAAASAAVIRRRAQRATNVTPPSSARLLTKYSAFYATTMSTNTVQNEGEKFVLAAARSTTVVGEYTAAYRIVSIALVPIGALSSAANRWFLSRNNDPNQNIRRSMRLSAVVAIYGLVAGAALLAGGRGVRWLLGPDFAEASTIAAWLAWLPLVHGLAEIPPMGLLGLGRNKERMYTGFITAVAALVAYLALVPGLGWRGAALGTYVSEAVCIAVGWIVLLRCQRTSDREASLVANAVST